MDLIFPSNSFKKEKLYIVGQILGWLTDEKIFISYSGQPYVQITKNGKKILMPNHFFKEEKKWLQMSSLPKRPLQVWNTPKEIHHLLIDGKIPVIYGDDVFKILDDGFKLPIDIFGSAFFMLNRYEEAVKKDKDEYDRFPVIASLAYQEGFLDRPIINEYIEILWFYMKKLWPELKRKKRKPKTILSCDVDAPFLYSAHSLYWTFLTMGGDIIHRYDPRLMFKTMIRYFIMMRDGPTIDPYYNFDWILKTAKKYDQKITFNFLCVRKAELDSNYSIRNKYITDLLKKIKNQKHEVGYHFSFNSYCDPSQLKKENELLSSVYRELGFKSKKKTSRQHWLRFTVPDTWQYLCDIGIETETSMSYPEKPGFRCGICYEYPVYNIKTRKELKIKESPLILMECTVTDDENMGLRTSYEAKQYMIMLKKRCYKYNGDFTLLWHNSRLTDKRSKEIFSNLISED